MNTKIIATSELKDSLLPADYLKPCAVCGATAVSHAPVSINGAPKADLALCQCHLDAAHEDVPAIKSGDYYRFVYPDYGTPDTHPDYTAHSGQIVRVDRPLTDQECDPECGPNYFVTALSDGWVGNANSSELKKVDVCAWENYLLLRRQSVGSAARDNRRSHSGRAIHRITVEEIVGVIDEAKETALTHSTLGKRFLQTRKPVEFSAWPNCGCCQGQHAAREVKGVTVTCKKCGGACY